MTKADRRAPARLRSAFTVLSGARSTVNGCQASTEPRRDPALTAIPTIVVTSNRFAEVPGTGAVLRKALGLDQLTAGIDRLLGRRRPAQ